MTTVTVPAGTRRTAAGPGLGQLFREFVRHPTPWLLVGYCVAAIAVRSWVGPWSLADLAVAGALLAAQPFVEWVIHVVVLHWKPRRLLGRPVDLAIAKSHRRHHRDPRNLKHLFIDIRAVLAGAPISVLLYSAIFPTRASAVTAMATAAALTLGYEWTHYLIHTDYQPRHALYRRIHRSHRLHHFKNENYWFGVTSTFGDHVLRTFPERDAVPTSPTARTLGAA